MNEFLSSSIGGHSTYCVMHRIKNNDEVFRLMKVKSLAEVMSMECLGMLISIQRTLSLKSCSSSLSMQDDRMKGYVVFSKEVERIRILLWR